MPNNINNSTICGYASVFNVKDAAGDIILPGAFTECLLSNPNIKLLWQHKYDVPIGIVQKLYEDQYGLFMEAYIITELDKGKEVSTLLKYNAINGLSIGFKMQDYFYGKDARYIKKALLWEISIVTFPALSAAQINTF